MKCLPQISASLGRNGALRRFLLLLLCVGSGTQQSHTWLENQACWKTLQVLLVAYFAQKELHKTIARQGWQDARRDAPTYVHTAGSAQAESQVACGGTQNLHK